MARVLRTARAAALACLRETARGEFLDEPRRRQAAELPAAERPLFFELVTGVVRRQATLDRILGGHLSGGLERTPEEVLRVLRLGLYQVLYLEGVPAHAAVHETVALLGAPKKRGLVNAVLRSFLRELGPVEAVPQRPDRRTLLVAGGARRLGRPVFPDPEKDPLGWIAAQQGFGRAAAQLLEEELGPAGARELMAIANRRPALTLRPRLGRVDAARLAAELEAEGGSTEALVGHPADLLVWTGSGDPTATAAFAAGFFSMQGPFAARVAALLAPAAGETVVDVCAAPGGKAAHMAELAPEARILAFALDEAGRGRIDAARERLGLTNLEARIFDGDPAALRALAAEAWLLDVPCSNSGVLDRRPEARRRLDGPRTAALRTLQRRLLEGVLDIAEAAGAPTRVVYSTCSVLPSENEGLVAEVLRSRPRARLSRVVEARPGDAAGEGGWAGRIDVESPDFGARGAPRYTARP